MVDWDPYKLLYESLDRPLSQSETAQIEAAIREHPQFALLHLLKAKAVPSTESVFEAALFTADRRLLKRYLENKVYFPASLAPKVDTMPQVVSPTKDPQLFSILDYDQLTYDMPPESKLFQMVQGESLDDATLDGQLRESVLRYLPLGNALRQQLSQYLQKDRSEAVIDRFLTDPPRLQRRKPGLLDNLTTSDPAIESIEPDQDLVTETLAQLHIRQNNQEEALRIYQKLRLRFPEKSAYFDDQIQKIKIL